MVRTIHLLGQISREAWLSRHLLLAVAVFALLAGLVAGCSPGGSTFPGGYHCTATANPYGCYTQIAFSHSHINPSDNNPDIAGDPVYAYSDLLVVPLTCDPACQASSGNGNPPGSIDNFLELLDQNGNSFLRAGYTTESTGMQYFVDYRLPGVNNGKYAYVNLGPAPTGNGGNTINYQYARVAMGHQAQLSFFGAAGDWVVIIEPPYGSSGFLSVDLGPSTFHPDTVDYGQAVYGTSGATALDAFFANNNIFATPFSAQHLTEVLTEDGSPPTVVQTVDHPTDAGWLIKATQSSTGGMFHVSCCQGKPLG